MIRLTYFDCCQPLLLKKKFIEIVSLGINCLQSQFSTLQLVLVGANALLCSLKR
jgi:hypothetical protein